MTECSNHHMAISWTHPGECPLCACYREFERIEDISLRVLSRSPIDGSDAVNALQDIHVISLLGASPEGDGQACV